MFRTIVADPPWQQAMIGKHKASKNKRPGALPYPTMTVAEVCDMPVAALAETGCHLWLWTTNAFLEGAFAVMRAWEFKYLTTVTWVKPSGCGAWFASTTQHVLFGYRQRCQFNGRRYAPTHFRANPRRHSEKPPEFYDLVEQVSDTPRLDLFARRVRENWAVWGNEVGSGNLQCLA